MSDWIIALDGTEAGHTAALSLAILAAFLHAVFGALQKGRFDPWATRTTVDACYFLMALPIVLFVVPWPEAHMWPILAGVFFIHLAYKLLQAGAYSFGAYTVVYPVVRGTGPLVTVVAAGIVFGEIFTGLQWAGVLTMTAGIFGLAIYNIVHTHVGRRKLLGALGLAFATGVLVAVYTTYDAFGIRASADPFTFLAWFFLIDGLSFPILFHRRVLTHPDRAALIRRGFVGAVVAIFSFGSIMLATRLDKVGEAAVLRETSTLFAAAIGILFLKETVGPRRIVLMALIALGAILVETGG